MMPVPIDILHVHEGVVFKDTILLTDAEYTALTTDQIEYMKQTRVQNWVASLSVDEE